MSAYQLRAEALELWHTYAKSYRNLLSDYDKALSDLKKVGRGRTGAKHPMPKIQRWALEEYKEIPFFRIETEEAVKKELEKKDEKQLNELIKKINKGVNSYSFTNIREFVKAANYYIHNNECKKYPFIDPDSCRNGRRCRIETGSPRKDESY